MPSEDFRNDAKVILVWGIIFTVLLTALWAWHQIVLFVTTLLIGAGASLLDLLVNVP